MIPRKQSAVAVTDVVDPKAARHVARLRVALDWMICHPLWEAAIGLSIAALGFKAQRQGISLRKAALSLPLPLKRDTIRAVLRGDLEAPSPQDATRLASLWGITSEGTFRRSSRLSHTAWESLRSTLLIRLAARFALYRESQELLYQQHAYLAQQCVARICRDRSRFEDALQEGRLGLLQAIDRIDPTQGFKGYARQWIERRIRNYLMKERSPFNAPINEISRALRSADTELGAASALARGLKHGTLSLDAESMAGAPAVRFLPSDPGESPLESAARADDGVALRAALDLLTNKQREVLSLRYGLGAADATQRSLAEVAAQTGISRQQVFQREKRALQTLAERLAVIQAER